MNEFQLRALFENRFGDTIESFGLSVVNDESGIHLAGHGKTLALAIVNEQQAGWQLNGAPFVDTSPRAPVLKPNDPARSSNAAALRAALA